MQTNSDPSTGIIVKSDRSGRVRYSGEFKREVLAAYESSSLSGPDFARQCGVKYPTLAAWVAARRRGAQSSAGKGGPTFLVAEVTYYGGGTFETKDPGADDYPTFWVPVSVTGSFKFGFEF